MRDDVELLAVDDVVLHRLVAAAVADADADDVTPSLDGSTEWTPERVRWLEDFHGRHRSGTSGLGAELTWAVVVANQVVGSVRLGPVPGSGVAEVGIWLTRSVRGRGVGHRAIELLVGLAEDMGFERLTATTSPMNRSARTILVSLDFAIADDDVSGSQVRANLELPRP